MAYGCCLHCLYLIALFVTGVPWGTLMMPLCCTFDYSWNNSVSGNEDLLLFAGCYNETMAARKPVSV